MHHRRAAVEEEALDRFQFGGGDDVEQTEAEGLRDGRGDAVEYSRGAEEFTPLGSAFRREAVAGGGEVGAGEAFGAFEATG
jgi:hypothetical protein